MDNLKADTTFRLTIELGGPSITTPQDLAHQLRKAAAVIDERGTDKPLKLIDSNGNTVGTWEIR